MVNTISSESLNKLEEMIVKELEQEKYILEKMTEGERIGYMAAKASFSK